jgi:hypothetical protein
MHSSGTVTINFRLIVFSTFFFVPDPLLILSWAAIPAWLGLRFAPVGAKRSSTGRAAPLRDQLFPAQVRVHTVAFVHLLHTVTARVVELLRVRVTDILGLLRGFS